MSSVRMPEVVEYHTAMGWTPLVRPGTGYGNCLLRKYHPSWSLSVAAVLGERNLT